MKPIIKNRRWMGIAAVLIVGACAVMLQKPLPTSPPRPADECSDEQALAEMVTEMEDPAQAHISLVLVRMTSKHAPWHGAYDLAKRILPNSDPQFLLPPLGTLQVFKTLNGPEMQGTHVMPDNDDVDESTTPRLGEYAIAELSSPSSLIYFRTYQHDATSPIVTAVEQYKDWATRPDHISAIQTATQIMHDNTQDPLVRLAAFYAMRRQWRRMMFKRHPQTNATAHSIRETEFDLLTSPDLPKGLTKAIMENISRTWTLDKVTPQERDRAARYLMTVVTRSHTRWKVGSAIDALSIMMLRDGPKTLDYYPEMLSPVSQRMACEEAVKSVFPGVVFGYSRAYDEGIDGVSDFIDMSETAANMNSGLSIILRDNPKRKIFTHRLLPAPNDELMHRLLTAAER